MGMEPAYPVVPITGVRSCSQFCVGAKEHADRYRSLGKRRASGKEDPSHREQSSAGLERPAIRQR
jgi:hypothetical protein